MGQVGKRFVEGFAVWPELPDYAADRDAQPEGLARGASALVRASGHTVLSDARPSVVIVAQGRVRAVGDEDDVSAAAAVAAVGPPARNELLSPERNRAVPAATGYDLDVDCIDHDFRVRVRAVDTQEPDENRHRGEEDV